MKQHESPAVLLLQLVGPSRGQDGAPDRGSYGVTELSVLKGACGLRPDSGFGRLEMPSGIWEMKLLAYANAERKEVGGAILSIRAL